ncbi:hypothetical protein Pfo_024860 [Paulownia fortunei]|nr:hypothetical protein Pfo_024860 [Paulownia fortunei]
MTRRKLRQFSEQFGAQGTENITLLYWCMKHALVREMNIYIGHNFPLIFSQQDSSRTHINENVEHIMVDGDGGAACEGSRVQEHDMGQENIGVQNDVNCEYLNDSDSLIDSDYNTESESNDDDDDDVFESSEDVVHNENDFNEHRVSDEDEECPSHPVYNTAVIYDLIFELGMIFGTKAKIRKVVQSHAIRIKKTLKFVKNDKIRVYVRCAGEECEWRINALKMKDECTFQIREFNPHHSCLQIFHIKNVKTNWLSEKYIQKFQSDSKRNVKGFRLDVINEIKCHELMNNGDERFSRFYVCFDALKKRFIPGCRPIIEVDGCHLKDPYGGVLLTAVGTDSNNNLYHIAYAIVCKECRETWKWFLIVLKKDLNITRTHEYTFMFCVRHLHNNFKNAGFKGLAFKNTLWRAAMASTPCEFKVRMSEMRDLNESVANWFNDKPPNQWSRSYFNEHCKWDMLLNNVCKSFNSNILDAREKPIITMFEWIREFLMRRLQENRGKAEAKWKCRLCPKIKKIIEKYMEKIGDCIPIKVDDRHYQISCIDGSQYYVDLEKWSCMCRMWGLSCILCKHAICANFNQNQLLEDFVHSCYTVETYKKVHAYAIMKISGEQLWAENALGEQNVVHRPHRKKLMIRKKSHAANQNIECTSDNIPNVCKRSQFTNQTVEGTSDSIQNLSNFLFHLINPSQ